jgi:hypothetical protein
MSTLRHLSILVVVAASASLLARDAHAQGAESAGTQTDPPLPPDDKPSSPTVPSSPENPAPGVSYPPDALIDARMRRSWSEGQTRLFLATTLDVGWTYLRPRASVGYGKPFGTWFGIDVNPIISGNGLGAYGGLRLALPRVDLRVGPRYMAAFNRNYLNPQTSYNRQDLDSTVGNPSRVLTFEAELEASVPAGPGDIIGLGSVSYVTGVPDGQYVFEETLRMIVNPPLVWRARLGYVFRFGSFRQHSLGLVADGLDVPGRDDSKTFRAGPIIRIVLSRRVEVRGSFVPTIISPDHLGLIGGDFTELGFRYRWATE